MPVPQEMTWELMPLRWQAHDDGEYPYTTFHNGQRLQIRVNDFPAEPLYTLILDGVEAGDLEDWPAAWLRPSEEAAP